MNNQTQLGVTVTQFTSLFELQTLFQTSNGPKENQIEDNNILCITSKDKGVFTLVARNGTISFYDRDEEFSPEDLTERTINLVIEKFCRTLKRSHHCTVEVTDGLTSTRSLKKFKFELKHNGDNYIFQNKYEYFELELCGPVREQFMVTGTQKLENIKGVELLPNKEELIHLNIVKYVPMSSVNLFFLKVEKGVLNPMEIEYEGATYAQHYAQVTAKPEQLSEGCKVYVYEKLIYR